MPQRIKSLKIHSREKLIETETRKHLSRLRVAIPPNLAAVIKALPYACEGLNRPVEFPAAMTPPPELKSLLLKSQAEIKATLAACLDRYPSAFFEIRDFLKRRKSSDSNRQRVADFLASNATFYSYFDGERTNYFCGGGVIRIINGAIKFIPHKGQPASSAPKIRKLAHKKLPAKVLAPMVQKIIGGTVNPRTIKDARKLLR
jgi:hypothetical protein